MKFPGIIETEQRTGGGRRKIVLNEQQRKWLTEVFPKTKSAAVAEMMGVSVDTVSNLARKLGLRKSEAGKRAIRRKAAQAAKKTCENNGYYDSLRGRCPSAEAMAGLAKYWEQVHSGEKENPMARMKREQPRRYHAMHRRRGEALRELYRKERLRLEYGMERKTRKALPRVPYRRSQVNRRLNALMRGYLVAEDSSDKGGQRYNIYYDEQTAISERFEQNCIKDGFRILRDTTTQ